MLKAVSIDDPMIASSTTELLMGTDVAPRREFIHENAKDALLDV